MVRFTLLLTLIFLSISTFSFDPGAKFGTFWREYKWPKDRTQDTVKLLPFGQELKLNYFLQHLKNQSGVSVHFHLVPSLQGDNLETASKVALAQEQEEDSEGRYLLFFLSLSDRQFRILPSEGLSTELDEEVLSDWVAQLIPHLRRQNYPKAIETFLQGALFELSPDSELIVPHLSLKKSYNLNSLLFFVVGFILIFMLGHKLRRSPRVIHKDSGLIKKKTTPLSLFW